jgi:hypothetical protein
MEKLKLFLARWWIVLVLAAFLPVYTVIAINNERNVDYLNNGFFTFWLSGKMVWTGESPYSSAAWVGGHHTHGATWIPNQIFPYPLPLALVTAPLGLLPINQAYILWDLVAQLLIAGCLLWLATRWEGLNRQLYVIFLLLATVLNGNVYLGLMTGTFAAFFLAVLTLALFFMETRRPLLAGLTLAFLALKPPLLTVTALIGLWLLFRRDWKALAGLALGGLGLLLVGLLQDPGWVQKFLGAGGNLFGMRLGHQPTLISYTRLACGGDMTCAFLGYSLAVAALLALYVGLVWRRRESLSPLMAFSAAIALGLLLPPYLWSYDYTLLVIPIAFVAFELIRRRETYLHATLFLLVLDVISIASLVLFWLNPDSPALTIQRDMWSIGVALLVLVATWILAFTRAGEKSIQVQPEGK